MVRLAGAVAGKLADGVGRDGGDLFRPFRGLFYAIGGLAHQVFLEFFVTDGVFVQEVGVVQPFLRQRMTHGKHHGDVGLRTRRDPLGVQVIDAIGAHRVDGDDAGALFLERLHSLEATVFGQDPVDLVGDGGIGAPQHHKLAVFDDHRPSGLLFVNLQAPHHMRHDDLRSAGGIVARCD